MKDRLIKILLSEITKHSITKEVIEKELPNIPEGTLFIDATQFVDLIGRVDEELERDKKYLMPKTKFLYIEDGSVDLDYLESSLFETNPEIKVITYRQGSCPPILSEEKLNGR